MRNVEQREKSLSQVHKQSTEDMEAEKKGRLFHLPSYLKVNKKGA